MRPRIQGNTARLYATSSRMCFSVAGRAAGAHASDTDDADTESDANGARRSGKPEAIQWERRHSGVADAPLNAMPLA